MINNGNGTNSSNNNRQQQMLTPQKYYNSRIVKCLTPIALATPNNKKGIKDVAENIFANTFIY